MRRLAIKSGVFLFGLVLLLGTSVWVSSKSELISTFFGKITNSAEYSRNSMNGGPTEIVPVIERAQKESNHTKLVLGDSVCDCLFEGLIETNEEYLLLGTNQAIGISGQYLLAKQFIESHENVTDIYLVLVSASWETDFGLRHGYPYAVMPFIKTDIFSQLDNETILAAEETYGRVFLNKSIVNLIDYSEMNRKIYLNLLHEYGSAPTRTYPLTSDIAVNNLVNLKSLCDDNNIALHIIAAPMPNREGMIDRLTTQQKEFEDRGLGELMKQYYNSVILYPEVCFPDGTHPTGEYGTREKLNEMIMNMQAKTGLFEGLHILD